MRFLVFSQIRGGLHIKTGAVSDLDVVANEESVIPLEEDGFVQMVIGSL